MVTVYALLRVLLERMMVLESIGQPDDIPARLRATHGIQELPY